jgi:hypothetical protein
MSCLQCFRTLSDKDLPHQLVCGHHVCSKCMESTKKCPVCLRKAVVDHLNMDSCPDCAGCLAKKGTLYCNTCFCVYCVECDAFFHSKIFTHRHSRIAANAPHRDDHLQLECVFHSKPLLFFCIECEMRVCEDCVTEDALSFRTTGRKGGGLDGGEVCNVAQCTMRLCYSIFIPPSMF